jgi:hypothetical protein
VAAPQTEGTGLPIIHGVLDDWQPVTAALAPTAAAENCSSGRFRWVRTYGNNKHSLVDPPYALLREEAQ